MRTTYRITLDIIENLKEEINHKIKEDTRFTNDIIEDKLNDLQEDINHQINCEVANACIYYSDCFDIVKELSVTDWEDLNKELGTISDICSLAMFALIQEIYESYESDIYDSMNTHYKDLRRDYILELIDSEIEDLENEWHYGSDENVENETIIFNYVLNNKIVSQDWFDERLKYDSIERLEAVKQELTK